jgi:hypothetical protein
MCSSADSCSTTITTSAATIKQSCRQRVGGWGAVACAAVPVAAKQQQKKCSNSYMIMPTRRGCVGGLEGVGVQVEIASSCSITVTKSSGNNYKIMLTQSGLTGIAAAPTVRKSAATIK